MFYINHHDNLLRCRQHLPSLSISLKPARVSEAWFIESFISTPLLLSCLPKPPKPHLINPVNTLKTTQPKSSPVDPLECLTGPVLAIQSSSAGPTHTEIGVSGKNPYVSCKGTPPKSLHNEMYPKGSYRQPVLRSLHNSRKRHIPVSSSFSMCLQFIFHVSVAYPK